MCKVERQLHLRITLAVVSAVFAFINFTQKKTLMGRRCRIRPRLSRGDGSLLCIRACASKSLLVVV